MPFLLLAYLICYIDRVNVGFASPRFNALGNLSGFACNYLIGAIRSSTGSFPLALMPIALLAGAGMVALLLTARGQPCTVPVRTWHARAPTQGQQAASLCLPERCGARPMDGSVPSPTRPGAGSPGRGPGHPPRQHATTTRGCRDRGRSARSALDAGGHLLIGMAPVLQGLRGTV